jgi:acetyl esterase/lipase
VVVATDDTLIPPRQSRDFHARLVALGVESRIVECEGMRHGEAECLRDAGARWVEDWWGQAIKPSLDFAIAKLGKQ